MLVAEPDKENERASDVSSAGGAGLSVPSSIVSNVVFSADGWPTVAAPGCVKSMVFLFLVVSIFVLRVRADQRKNIVPVS